MAGVAREPQPLLLVRVRLEEHPHRQHASGACPKPWRPTTTGGNWKCNPATASSLDELVSNFDGCAQYLDKCDVYVCPSNLHVALVKDSFKPGIKVAPQNCNFTGCGAYTGEMAVDQMADMGIEWVLDEAPRGVLGFRTPRGRQIAASASVESLGERREIAASASVESLGARRAAGV